jgi:hypothetical protein
LYPGIQISEVARSQYENAIKSACENAGAHYYRPSDSATFSWSDFSEILHMNACGGYKLYSNIAGYIRQHREELFESARATSLPQ